VSTEYVELLRRIYASRSLAEFGAALHPDAEFHQDRVIPDTDDYYGRDEFVRGVERWLEEWETFRYIPEEITDLGERAYMRVRLVGRAKASGIELDQTIFHLWTFKDGMPWRCDVYFDEAQALEAVRAVS
jgi:ketosteroid isomerase-like protein